MENSPIVLAHNHARSALIETRRSNPVAASEEHDLAAAEFATAAQGTSESEATRILLLLEQHHKKLGQILKSRHETSSQIPQAPDVIPTLQPVTSKAAEAAAIPLRTSSPESNPAIPKLSQALRASHRDGPNSIASNLASARGIPGSQQRRSSPASPTVSAQHAGGRLVGSPSASKTADLSTRYTSQNSKSSTGEHQPISAQHSQPSSTDQIPSDADLTAASDQKEQNGGSDAPFQQFYNTFESLISKISAPLAFAGLPLTSASPATSVEPEPTPVKPKRQGPKPPAPTQPDPHSGAELDYSKMISRAALRAVRDGIPNPVAESFYVVPTTGGTVSYASILNREQKEANRHHRQLSNISEDANDDFVDARETILPSGAASPELTRLDAAASTPLRGRHSRQSTSGSTSSRRVEQPSVTVAGKTMEELALENQALKHLSDTLSKRLHMWEVNAQSSSAALQQSLRSLQAYPRASSPASTTRSDSGKGHSTKSKANPTTDETTTGAEKTATGGETDKERIDELEDMIRRLEKEKGRQDRENEKLKNVVGRYRERWEKLKEGAKSRREGAATGTNTGTATNDGTGAGDGRSRTATDGDDTNMTG